MDDLDVEVSWLVGVVTVITLFVVLLVLFSDVSVILLSASIAERKELLFVVVVVLLVLFVSVSVVGIDGVGMFEGKFVLWSSSSSSLHRSIVVLTLSFTTSSNDESISMKMDTHAAAARDLHPFLKNFCLDGISFLISKMAFILVSFSRISKKLSACCFPESFLSNLSLDGKHSYKIFARLYQQSSIFPREQETLMTSQWMLYQ